MRLPGVNENTGLVEMGSAGMEKLTQQLSDNLSNVEVGGREIKSLVGDPARR